MQTGMQSRVGRGASRYGNAFRYGVSALAIAAAGVFLYLTSGVGAEALCPPPTPGAVSLFCN